MTDERSWEWVWLLPLHMCFYRQVNVHLESPYLYNSSLFRHHNKQPCICESLKEKSRLNDNLHFFSGWFLEVIWIKMITSKKHHVLPSQQSFCRVSFGCVFWSQGWGDIYRRSLSQNVRGIKLALSDAWSFPISRMYTNVIFSQTDTALVGTGQK